MKPADLHMHTNFSDGHFSPEQVVEFAIKRKMKAIAITDHHTVLGVRKAKESAGNRIKIIPGIEITCPAQEIGITKVDILGLFINSEKMPSKYGEKGKNTAVELFNKFKSLLKRAGLSKLFLRLSLGLYLKVSLNTKPSIKQAIDIIKNAGGIPVLAHPGLVKESQIEALVQYFKGQGGKAIETYYPYERTYFFSQEKAARMRKLTLTLARKYKLLLSGGSDFHGDGRNVAIGDSGISLAELSKLAR